MDKTTARALSGFFIAFNHAMSSEAAALVNDILLRFADDSPARACRVLSLDGRKHDRRRTRSVAGTPTLRK